jgi:peptidoglycan/LPS O-acetylase OafA/YrhL
VATRRLRYLPAVDGLRAVAVAAVIAFHLAPDAVPGGFLGVDTFFVVSGYLITALLLAEHAADGGIGLRHFWARRARRLLPALLLLLCAVAVGVAVWWPAEDLARVRADALAGLGYVANWRFIAGGESYFDLATGPSPLRHLWSLAIEEQFYVVWPLVALACLRRSPRLLGAVSIAGAVASAAVLIAIGPGDRAYFGTDARAHALLVGAALAVGLRHRRAAAPPWLGPAGGAALAACAAAWWVAGESSTWLFTWGFPAYALLTAVVVASVVRVGDGALARVLSSAPLVAMGKVSYGLYLWHWPAIVLLTTPRTGLDGVALGAFRLAATVAGTLVSYWIVERPVRFGSTVRGWLAGLATGTALTGTAVVVVVATAGAAPVPDYLRAPTDTGAPIAAISMNDPVAVTTTTAAPHEPRHPTSVLLVGDSIAWTFQDELGAALAPRGVGYASAAVVGCGAAVGLDPALGFVAEDDGTPHSWALNCFVAVTDLQREGMATVQPDLVLFHSTWETADRDRDGQWIRYGTPTWDETVRAELRAAVDRLTAGGARLAILTVPPTVDGDLRPIDPTDLERRAHYNGLLREVAAEEPARVRLVEFASMVCGGSVDPCADSVDGIRLRPLDGSHFEDEGAAWVGERLADVVVGLDLGAVSALAAGEGEADAEADHDDTAGAAGGLDAPR